MAIPDPRKSRAVVVGIGDYAHDDLATMPAAATGASHLAGLLRDLSVWGLPQDHVTVLGAETSGVRILTAVKDAAVATEETLLVYFAGHGLRDLGGHLYLALADADPDYPQLGTLPYLQLRDLMRQSGHRARHRVTVLDCCYSGIAGGMSPTAAPSRDELAHALDERAHANGADEEEHGQGEDGHGDGHGDSYGDCVLTSAPAESRSFVRPGASFPEFTGELITTLGAGITGAGSLISLESTWLRVRDRMRSRGSPEPQHFAQNNATRHIHFHNRATRERRASEPGPGTSAAHLAALAAAERAARAVPDVLGRMRLLAEIAGATARVAPDRAGQFADEVIRAGRETTDPTQRALLMAKAATSLVALDPARARRLVDEAESTIQGLAELPTRASGLASLADALAATDRDRATWLVEEAEEVIDSLPNSRDKGDLLRRLSYCGVLDDTPEWRQRLVAEAENLRDADRYSDAFDEASRRSSRDALLADEARATADLQRRVEKLVRVAKDLVEHKHHHQALELLEEAAQTIPQVSHRKREMALYDLTGALPRGVGWAARTSPDRVIALLARARRLVDDLNDDDDRADRLEDLAKALSDVAWHLADTDPRRAVDLIRQAQGIIPHLAGSRQRALGDHVALALVQVGKGLVPVDAERAVELAHEAWGIASSQGDGLQKQWVSRDAVEVLAQAGGHLAGASPSRAEALIREAESLAHVLPEQERTRGLRAVAEALAKAGEAVAGTRPDRVDTFVRESERMALGLPGTEAKWPLSAIARALATAGKAVAGRDPDRAIRYAREAERVIRISPDGKEHKDLDLSRIMDLQVEIVTHRPAHADRAGRTAERFTDDMRRAHALYRLVKALVPVDTERAEPLAQTITDPLWKALALVEILRAHTAS
ncbi:caspase, EACC1-associated type [Streptomyces johnsoniae]|uniref:Caspase family protein n=1 Tax=Streptomyces johnsoniae TaxID=3075532 RepID=A0ABU2S5F0_9ACTN|nr:caspase family protein [Streptomyces sp. DSM 41886]MDT0444048.1 caspase family protein [Streptomyces sp. DSM 41886]